MPEGQTEATITAFSGVQRGRNLAFLVTILPLTVFVWCVLRLPEAAAGTPASYTWDWVPSLRVSLTVNLDGLALLFALIISGIGVLVYLYAASYLQGTPLVTQFFAALVMFTLSMLGVVLASNLIVLYVFWELTTLASFFLIGHDHTRLEARDAALQSLLTTSGGGLVMLAGFVLLGQAGGSFETGVLAERTDTVLQSPLLPLIVILVLVGAFTKSAQFPFYYWLPNAMEAPAPVSAFLHSATMVNAGIYLIARLTPVLGQSALWTWLVIGAGTITMVLGSVLALRQTDLKRMLAYTTVGALGMMTLLLGVGTEAAFKGAMVYLLTHALYKGALFLAAGAIDHATGTRDLTELSGLRHKMPITFLAALLAAISMAGIPLTIGFLGKEASYDAAFHAPELAWILLTAMIVSNIGMGAAAFIIVLQPFLGEPASTPRTPHDAPLSMLLGPLVLAAGGLVLGVVPAWVAERLISPAISAITGVPEQAEMVLYPGITVVVVLSAFTIIFAGVVAWKPQFVRARLLGFHHLARVSPAAGFEHGLHLLDESSRAITKVLQNGLLTSYVRIIVLSAVLLTGVTFLTHLSLPQLFAIVPADITSVRVYELVVAAAIVASAIATIRATGRLAAIAALGGVGYGVTLIFVFFGAPDLAVTQFAIETLSVIVFVLVLYKLPRFAIFSSRRGRLRDGAVAALFGMLMTMLVLSASGTPIEPAISNFFATQSALRAHGRNVVNVILVDFRGFDTLGEITVLGVAAIGVFALLKLRMGSDDSA